MLASTADGRQIRLSFDSSDDPLRVTLVEGEVKQILYNLIRNAIQASPSGEEVSIRTSHDAGEIIVRIEDRGPGIRDDIFSHILIPFSAPSRQTCKLAWDWGSPSRAV